MMNLNPEPVIPRLVTRQTIASPADYTDRQYLAFPSVIRTGEREVLIACKRGRSHAVDPGAGIDSFRFDTVENRVTEAMTIARVDDLIMQMGEWVRFPNGDIANYIDVHVAGIKQIVYRTGMQYVRSTDGGKSFGPLETVGVVDGVEYGYPFEHLVVGDTTYLLVMTFEYLAGRRGTVDVIASDDNGSSWRFVRNLTKEFGSPPINETTFVRYGEGFLVSSRGYDSRERLHRLDASFALEAQSDLTETCPVIDRQLGRPRLFEHGGRYYLMGRNYTAAGTDAVMKRCLFRIDPESLSVTSWAILDNHEEGKVIDGYYPVCYRQSREGREYFNIIDYKSVMSRYPGPEIIRQEYDWAELEEGLR